MSPDAREAVLEAFLARLYTDRPFLERFLADPVPAMREAGLDEEAQRSAAGMDRAGLLLAVHSFERKRAGRGARRVRPAYWPGGYRRVRAVLCGMGGVWTRLAGRLTRGLAGGWAGVLRAARGGVPGSRQVEPPT